MNSTFELNLAEALQRGTADDASASLLYACALAAISFSDAVAYLQLRLEAPPPIDVLRHIVDPGAIACSIYLLAQAHSADLAADAGWHVLEAGCDDDQVVIALADVLQLQTHPRQAAAALMQQRASAHRSTAFLIKLADHYRTGGQAFLAEDVLRDLIRQGRNDLSLRLAELWVEGEDWRSARDILRTLSTDQRTPYVLYLIGRCAASLLLEDEVIDTVETLRSLSGSDCRYATLLQCVWTWRVGNPAAAAQSCPDGTFPPLIQRDAYSLRSVEASIIQEPPLPLPSVWRNISSRQDLPNVLGIGMQRTGTTWLWRQLYKHPDVQAIAFKELVFFNGYFDSPNRPGSDLRNDVFGGAELRYWQGPTRSLLHYRSIYADTKPVRIDISPGYAELPDEAVARVREILGPDVKIILCVRDPVERSWSNLKYNLTYTKTHPFAFSFPQRAAAYRNVATLRRCDYASVVTTWRRFFRNLTIVFMDDIISRPQETVGALGRLLGFTSWTGNDMTSPVNVTETIDMPRDDRLFLFGLHQRTYDAAEQILCGPALGWRQRQLELLQS